MATDIDDWTDAQIREKFEELGAPVGPVTATTRKIMLKRLKIMIGQNGIPSPKAQEEETYEEDEPDVAPVTRPPRRLGRSALKALNETRMSQESPTSLSPSRKSPGRNSVASTPKKDGDASFARETRTRSPARKSVGRASDFFTPEFSQEEQRPPRKVTPGRKVPESEESVSSSVRSISPSRISSGSYGNYDMIEKRKSFQHSIDDSIRESRRSISVANEAFRSRLLDPSSLGHSSPKFNDKINTFKTSASHNDDSLSDDEDMLASPVRITRGNKSTGYEVRSVKGARVFPVALIFAFVVPLTILLGSYALFYNSIPTEVTSHKYIIPVCRGSSVDIAGVTCIEEVDRLPVESLFNAFRQGLVEVQRTAPCTTSSHQPLFIDNNAIKEIIINNDKTISVWLIEKKLPDMKVILDSNHFLNVRSRSDGVSLIKGPDSFLCFVWSKTVLLSEWIIKIGITTMLGVLVYFGVQWHLTSQQKQNDDICAAIDKVVDLAKSRKFVSFETAGKELEEYGFNPEVIKEALSGAAKDSRLSLESKLNIHGFTVNLESSSNGLSWESGRGDAGGDSYVIPLSCCLKVRGMFSPTKKILNDQDIRMIVDVILEKSIGNRIVHVVVDRKSPEGIVYLRCLSKAEAGGVYRRLDGTAYEGRMLSVKYVLESRYNEKFPDSESYSRPLRPSS